MTTDEAIEWAGGTQAALARKLGIKQPSVSTWGPHPPMVRQYQIQAMSNGALRADVPTGRGADEQPGIEMVHAVGGGSMSG